MQTETKATANKKKIKRQGSKHWIQEVECG